MKPAGEATDLSVTIQNETDIVTARMRGRAVALQIGFSPAHATLLARENEDERRSGHLAAIDKAVDRGASLVRQLLTFARKSETRFEALDLNAVVFTLARLSPIVSIWN